MIITDNNAVIKINCFAEYFALSLEPCPINWAATTAPPVPNAAKILINKKTKKDNKMNNKLKLNKKSKKR